MGKGPKTTVSRSAKASHKQQGRRARSANTSPVPAKRGPGRPSKRVTARAATLEASGAPQKRSAKAAGKVWFARALYCVF
jgi:hypothetical protein